MSASAIPRMSTCMDCPPAYFEHVTANVTSSGRYPAATASFRSVRTSLAIEATSRQPVYLEPFTVVYTTGPEVPCCVTSPVGGVNVGSLRHRASRASRVVSRSTTAVRASSLPCTVATRTSCHRSSRTCGGTFGTIVSTWSMSSTITLDPLTIASASSVRARAWVAAVSVPVEGSRVRPVSSRAVAANCPPTGTPLGCREMFSLMPRRCAGDRRLSCVEQKLPDDGHRVELHGGRVARQVGAPLEPSGGLVDEPDGGVGPHERRVVIEEVFAGAGDDLEVGGVLAAPVGDQVRPAGEGRPLQVAHGFLGVDERHHGDGQACAGSGCRPASSRASRCGQWTSRTSYRAAEIAAIGPSRTPA